MRFERVGLVVGDVELVAEGVGAFVEGGGGLVFAAAAAVSAAAAATEEFGALFVGVFERVEEAGEGEFVGRFVLHDFLAGHVVVVESEGGCSEVVVGVDGVVVPDEVYE